jgi:hypothetical protein
MGRRKLVSRNSREHIGKEELLDFLRAGIALSVAVAAPNALRIFKPWANTHKVWKRFYPSSIERHTMKLWRKGFVDVKETDQGFKVTITEKGETEVLKYDLENLTIATPDDWDGKWRMVFFDIPSGHENRNHFREKLLSLGFFQMQKSVYIYPFPCKKEIQYLREVYNMPHSVKFATVSWLENDDDLRRFFRLS